MSWELGELRTVRIGTSRKLVRRDAHRTTYKDRKIPAPYDRIVCQLLAEDRHGNSHKSHESLRRQSYARRVLDEFVEELGAYKGEPAAFCSYTLSPILARQLQGTPDSSSTMINDCVQDEERANEEDNRLVTIGEATRFYLGCDLTDPELIPEYRINLVNIVEAMWHLAIVMGVIQENSQRAYDSFRTQYDQLMEWLRTVRGVEGWESEDAAMEIENDPDLNAAEVAMILACKVEEFFDEELKRVVCHIQLSTNCR